MRLTRLQGENFRNFSSFSIDLEDGVNLFFGANGSGKTSLLETVFFLGSGRSFRGVKIDPLMKRGTEHYLVSGEVSSATEGTVSLGLRRDSSGDRQIRINGSNESRLSELARRLPHLVLGPDTVDLLRGTPAVRRNFLNLGLFHVEHSFGETWRQASRVLQQRNNLLRQERCDPVFLQSWTEQLVGLAEKIDVLRQSHFDQFLPVFTETYRFLMDLEGVKCSYRRGWDSERDLTQVYQDQLESDQLRKFTQSGFQRADLRFTCNGEPVSQVCSRGELKLLSWAATLAQGAILNKDGVQPIYLVDDLIAELDNKHQLAIAELLSKQGGQVLATGTDENLLKALWNKGYSKMFHVKQGSVIELEVTK